MKKFAVLVLLSFGLSPVLGMAADSAPSTPAPATLEDLLNIAGAKTGIPSCTKIGEPCDQFTACCGAALCNSSAHVCR